MKKENEPMEAYLADESIGSSQLKTILDSPKDYKYSLMQPAKETASQTKGTLWHTYMLEREQYLEKHMIQPADWGPLTQNPGKKLWDEFKKKAKEEGKTPVKFKDASDLLLLDAEMNSHSTLNGILETHKAEVSFYSELNGIKLKSREDLWCEETGTVWDVKTTSKPVSNEQLEKTVFDNGYHFSAAHHMAVMKQAGFDVKQWGWIFVSTSTPCPHIVIRKASDELLQAGERDWIYTFEVLQECMKKNIWPGYDEEILEIGLPEWIERKYYDGL